MSASNRVIRRATKSRTRTVLLSGASIAALLCALAAPGPAGAVTPDGARQPQAAANVGVNLPEGSSWGFPFVDAAKAMRPFSSATDGAGWPTTDASTLLWDSRPVAAWIGQIDDPEQFTPNMAGTYKLSFTGQADLAATEGQFSIANKTYDAGSNTTRADLVVPTGLNATNNLAGLTFTRTQRTASSAEGTGFTNLKVIRPGYPADTTQLFHTPFLDLLRSANFSTLRSMDWTYTNNANPDYPATIDWSQRKQTTDATQQKWGVKQDGVAWEHTFDLANELDKDLWINVPVHASWNYMTSLAQLAEDRLEPGRRLYVEYSNEVWNWSFYQSTWNRLKAESEGLNYIQGYAKRTVEMAKAFESVFGTAALNDRIRVVNAWQIGWQPPETQYDEQMTFISNTFGEPKQWIYGLGVAPYYGCGSACDSGSAADIVAAMRAGSDGSVNARKAVKSIADKWQLPGGLMAYEGGTDTGGGDPTNIANKIAAERSPAVKDVIIRDLRTNWAELGGGLYMYFGLITPYSRFGSWGLTDDVNNPDRNSKFAGIRGAS